MSLQLQASKLRSLLEYVLVGRLSIKNRNSKKTKRVHKQMTLQLQLKLTFCVRTLLIFRIVIFHSFPGNFAAPSLSASSCYIGG